MPFAIVWMDLKGIMLSEINKDHRTSIYVELKKKKHLIDTENKLEVARGRSRGGVGEEGEGGQNVQSSNYKISHEDRRFSTRTVVNNNVLYI